MGEVSELRRIQLLVTNVVKGKSRTRMGKSRMDKQSTVKSTWEQNRVFHRDGAEPNISGT